ncbi:MULTISPECIES: hypothetical protein [Olivibacter]|jgi:hypothetical protein|uniref:Uncharacterized protein n=1 Tax=Olivibacter jilunii TaxID=985016 RepID=A0ABW6B464_9SPHI|nr:hypothetical protein [Olivibacter sp. UJ_SKK_5.1]MDX3915942.1 hypothetical protein [Pseudosphingobacterium sp.]
MKKQQMVRGLVIFSFILLASFKSSYAQNVEVPIILPYTGNFNNWIITFTSGSDTYTFETNDDTFDSGILGTLPKGTYTINFNSPYFSSENFDILVYDGSDLTGHGITSFTDLTLYNVVIGDEPLIQIDAGY